MNKFVNKLMIKYWSPVIFWALLIFFLSSLQGTDLPLFPQADKVIHIGIYAVLGLLIMRALKKLYNLNRGMLIFIATLSAGIYGLTDEAHQMFVSTRSAELFDLLADFLGGFVGAVLYGYHSYICKKD